MVLDVVPHAEELAQSLVANLLIIFDRVQGRADFNPPKTAFNLTVTAIRKILLCGKARCPIRWFVGDGLSGIARTKEQGVSHRSARGRNRGEHLLILRPRFNAPLKLCPGAKT